MYSSTIAVLFLLLDFRKNIQGLSLKPRILNGRNATDDEFPYIASFVWKQANNRRQHYCGGAILNRYWILTAAHCVYEYNHEYIFTILFKQPSARFGNELYVDSFNIFSELTPLNILTGTHKTDTGGNLYKSVDVKVHKGFNETILGSDDIALVKTSSQIEFCAFVQPIALAKTNPLIYPPDRYFFAGWGATKVNKTFDKDGDVIYIPFDYPNNLQVTTLYPLNLQQCGMIFGELKASGHICAYRPNTPSACDRDSGGPLVYANQIFGILILAEEYCGSTTVFMNVYWFKDWITATIKEEACDDI